MSLAFLMRFQESCPQDTVPTTSCATKTVTFIKNPEQGDKDRSQAKFGALTPIEEVSEVDIRLATQTVTKKQPEQSDPDPKNSAYQTIPSEPTASVLLSPTYQTDHGRDEPCDH